MAGFYCLVWVGFFGFVCLCLVFSFCFFVNLYYQSKDLKCSWISVMFLFTASCPKWDIRPVAYAGIGLCEQQQKSCPERWMFLGEWMHTAPLSFLVLPWILLYRSPSSTVWFLWISQLFPGCFLQGLGAVLESSDLVMVHDQVNSCSHGSQFSLVFCWCAMQTGITQPVCRQTHRVLLSHSSTSRVEILLWLYLDVPAHVWAGMHLLCTYPFRLRYPPLPSPLTAPLPSPSPEQLPAQMEGLPVPFSWKLPASGNSKSCPRPEQWNFVVSKSLWPECCSKRVQHLLPLFRMRELQSNIKKAARALNYSAMEHCHSSIKLLWPVVFYGVHCS